MKNHKEVVRRLLHEAGQQGITNLDIFNAGAGMRGADVIFRLKKDDGLVINTLPVSGQHYCRYVLVSDPADQSAKPAGENTAVTAA